GGGGEWAREGGSVACRRITRRVAVAAAVTGLLLAARRPAATRAGAGVLAVRLCRRPGPRRGGGAAREPAGPARPGLPGPRRGVPRRRRQHGRHRRARARTGARAGRAAADRRRAR